MNQAVLVLERNGPAEGRPLVDTITASRIANMKELRPPSAGRSEIRILLVFDPWRSVVLLVAGDKSGQWDKWYRSGRRPVVRTLALPLSFLFLGLGFAGILLGDRRRALHDVIAGTAVIYSWDGRAARLRFLSRK